MKIIYSGLFLCAYAMCNAMYQSPNQEKIYTIQGSDGTVIELPESMAEKMVAFAGGDDHDSDFWSHDFSFKESGLNISGELLKKLETCLQNPNTIAQFDQYTISTLLEMADGLGVEHSLVRELARRAHKKFPENEQFTFFYNYFMNSIVQLWFEGFFIKNNEKNFLVEKQDAQQHSIYCLDLADRKLDTMHGIEKVAPILKGKRITKLRLNDNCLKEVDLHQLFTLFPGIKKLKLQNNELSAMHFPSTMRRTIKINLDNNPIKRITGKLSEESVLSMRKNIITKELWDSLNSSIKPSWYDEHRYQIKSICSFQTLKALGLCGLLGGIPMNLIIFAVVFPLSNQKINDFVSDRPFHILCGSVFAIFGLYGTCCYNNYNGFPKYQAIDGFKPATIIMQ
jgi:hypothetical protein